MRNKLVGFLVVLLVLTGCAQKKEAHLVPLPEEVRAMWFSYVDFEKEIKHVDKDKVEEKIEEIVATCEEIGINTIFVHAVAFTDSFYDSKIYPKSTRSNHEIDYLKLFIDKAHQKKMHIEAWINPMRSVTLDEMKNIDDSFIIKKWVNENNPSIQLFNDRYYLNPATTETTDLIVSVVEEIVENYSVDGIHMDDYFYPAKVESSFDEEQFMKSGFSDISTYRKDIVNTLVKKIYDITSKNDLVFGISPSGNLEYSRDVIYGDTESWVQEGSVDYIIPQIYWGYTHKTKPFEATLQQWQDVVEGTDIDLIVGLAAYKIGVPSKDSDEFEWNNDKEILSKQISSSKLMNKYRGVAIFSYHSLFGQENTLVKENINNLIKQKITKE